MPRRFAPRNDSGGRPLHPLTPGKFPHVLAPNVPAPAHACQVSACPRAKRPCNRAHASSFSMSLRTSAHTGAAIRVPAEKLCKLAILRANLWRFSDSPKVLLFVLLYCEENGLPRRFAPRNDMLKHGRCPQGNDVAPGEFVTLFGFAQSTASRHALPQGERIVPSLRSSQ